MKHLKRVTISATVWLSILSMQLPLQPAWATGSESYRFTYQLLEVLNYCYWVSDYIGRNKTDVVEILKNRHLADGQFSRADLSVGSFVNSQDPWIKKEAGIMKVTIANLKATNQNIINVLSKDMNFKSEAEIYAHIAELLARQQEAWNLLTEAASYNAYVLINASPTENPTGPIPFRVSEGERKKLLSRIEELFGDEIEAYRDARRQIEQGTMKREDFSVNAVIFVATYLDSALRNVTYKQAATDRKRAFAGTD